MRPLVVTVLFTLILTGSAASQSQAPPPPQPRLVVPERTGTGTVIPPGVTLDDGLAVDEAVAIALWNNPDFRVQLTDLGFARADLVEAGLLKNPVLSLLFPIGPKQFEMALRFPFEVLRERPRRVAAAKVALAKVATGLEQHGLNLIADVKIAYVELGLAGDRAALAEATAKQLEEIAKITDARLRAGDISELEARSAAIDAARARQDADRARSEIQLRANDLRGRLGLSLHPAQIALASGTPAASACPDRPALLAALLKDAIAARPDCRARIGVRRSGEDGMGEVAHHRRDRSST